MVRSPTKDAYIKSKNKSGNKKSSYLGTFPVSCGIMLGGN